MAVATPGAAHGRQSRRAGTASAAIGPRAAVRADERRRYSGFALGATLVGIVGLGIGTFVTRYRRRCIVVPLHYETLGLCRDASTSDVREAYYRLTKAHAGRQEHVQMQEAFHVLSRPELRARYDAGAAAEQEASAAAEDDPVRTVVRELTSVEDGVSGNVSAPTSPVELTMASGASIDPWRRFFSTLAASRTFRLQVWQRRPFILGRPVPLAWARDACVKWKDLRSALKAYPDTEVIQFDEAVSKGTSRSWKDSRLVPGGTVDAAMKSATIFVNYGWAVVPRASVINEAVVEALGLPSNTNLYATAPGLRFDSVPHSDAQDVFILQCDGRKHWKVWTPPKLMPTWHQRGKDGDEIDPDALGPPIIETVLEPLESMYVPVGFAHVTTTDEAHIGYKGGSGKNEISVHLTIGMETVSAGFTMASFLRCILKGIGLANTVVMEHFLAMVEHDIDFRRPLPIGFLAQDARDEGGSTALLVATSALRLLERLSKRLDEDLSKAFWELVTADRVGTIASQVLDLHRDFLQAIREEFRGVRHNTSGPSPREWQRRHEATAKRLARSFEESCRASV